MSTGEPDMINTLTCIKDLDDKKVTPLMDFYEWYKEANASDRGMVLQELRRRLKLEK